MFNISGSEHPDLLRVYKKVAKICDDSFIFKKRKKRERIYRYLRRISLIIITLSLVSGLYLSIHFFSIRLIISEAIHGKNNIDKAVTLLNDNENEAALYYAKLSQDNFETCSAYLHEYKDSRFIGGWTYLKKQYSDLDYLFSTANTAGRAVENGALLKINLNKIISENQGENENKKSEALLKFSYESAPELVGIKANLDLAIDYFSNIKFQGILHYFAPQVMQMGDQIAFASYLLDKQIPLSQILPAFLGYPEKSRYLLVVQDSRTMMPTGGKIIAYGIWENENGEIKNLQIQPLSQEISESDSGIATPLLVRNQLHQEKWGTEYANWNPDWPQTAKNILNFYKKTNIKNTEFDGVIAINNEFVRQMLNLSGPIKVDNTWYDSDNYNQAFDSEKGISDLASLIREGKQKLFAGSQAQIFSSINFLSINLAKKNLILYFNDPSLEQIVAEENWNGQIRNQQSGEDYLSIIDANISGNKNEKAISKNINYSLDQDMNGAFVQLKINYANQNIPRDQIYKNYLRIYVPLGSELIDADGFDNGEVSIDADAANSKTIFSGIITIDAAKMANIKINYKLPDSLNQKISEGEYQLYAQKQAGNEVGLFIVDLKFANSIKLYNPTGLGTDMVNSNQVHWQTNFLSDRLFNVTLN